MNMRRNLRSTFQSILWYAKGSSSHACAREQRAQSMWTPSTSKLRSLHCCATLQASINDASYRGIALDVSRVASLIDCGLHDLLLPEKFGSSSLQILAIQDVEGRHLKSITMPHSCTFLKVLKLHCRVSQGRQTKVKLLLCCIPSLECLSGKAWASC